MDKIVSERNKIRVHCGTKRNENFRQNVIATLKWFCAEHKLRDITYALTELFDSAPRCDLIDCRIDCEDEPAFLDDTQMNGSNVGEPSTSNIPFCSEYSATTSSLVQLCINGKSADGAFWAASLQIAVSEERDQVWQTILKDIGCEPLQSESGPLGLTERDMSTLEFSANDTFKTPDQKKLGIDVIARELAHELRNPLGSIMTASGLFNTGECNELTSEDRGLLRLIESEAERVDRLLQNFVDLNKPVELRRTTQDLVDLLRDVLREASEETIGLLEIAKLHPPSGDTDMVINVDSELIKQVFTFMVGELPKMTKSLSSLDIRCCRDRNSVMVRFEYKCDGNRPDLLRKVVLPFNSAKDGGSGLRMIPVHKIITDHQGELLYSSDDKITMITIILPSGGIR